MTLNIEKAVFSDFTDNKVETNRQLSFKTKDVDLAVINSIRRIINSEIPNLSFEFKAKPDAEDLAHPENRSIQIATNTHYLNNEILAHRLAMLHLNFDPDEISNFKEHPRKYTFKLKKKNTTDVAIDVLTSDIEIYDENNKKYPKDFHEKIFPSDHITKDYQLITRLRPNRINRLEGEEIDIVMYPKLGIGQKHACWKYLSKFVHSYIVDDTTANRVLKELLEKKRKANPEITAKELDEIKDDFNHLDRKRITYLNEYGEPNRFYISCESESRTDPRYLVYRSIKLLDDKLDRVIRELLDDDITIQFEGITDKAGTDTHIYYLEIQGENATLGNLIQSLFVNYFIRQEIGRAHV